MDNLFENNSGEKSEHPSREMLLLFVDGELPSKEAAHLETHLEACWPCRVKTKKIQEAIADIIEFDEQVLIPRIIPPQGWRGFDRQLRQLVAQSGSQSLRSRLLGSLGRFLPSSHLLVFPRPLLKPMVRNALAVLTLILIVALLIRFRHEPTVSASELLRNAIDAQAAQLRSTNEPVLHQKLQVRRKDKTSAVEESVNLEIWNDTKNSRVRQFVADGGETMLVPAEKPTAFGSPRASLNPLVSEVAQVLQFNHMDSQRPLSAASYQAWHRMLQGQQDEVTRTKLDSGADALRLRTVPAAPVSIGQISEAEFIVRAQDWQPTYLRINVVAEGGSRIYELTEAISEVVSLAEVNQAIFADQPIVAPSPTASPKELAKKEAQPTPALEPNPQPLNPTLLATAELEVEALRLLNQAGADLGEQITVKRASGVLEITGIVETDQRKNEIINVLSPIASNPAVRIEIQTVAEAVAKETTTKATSSPSARAVEITGNTIAAEPDLRAYFTGKDADKAIHQYAARMVTASGRSMDHLWAMKRLFNQFTPEELRALTPEARAKWIGLIRAHARLYQQTTQSLRRELQPIFFPGQSLGPVSADTTITDENELSRVVDQLFELGSSNDRVIRSAFTSSSGGAMTTVIKAPQFWQSLRSAESLAARIAH